VSIPVGQLCVKRDKERAGNHKMPKNRANECLLGDSRQCDGMVNAESTRWCRYPLLHRLSRVALR